MQTNKNFPNCYSDFIWFFYVILNNATLWTASTLTIFFHGIKIGFFENNSTFLWHSFRGKILQVIFCLQYLEALHNPSYETFFYVRKQARLAQP